MPVSYQGSQEKEKEIILPVAKEFMTKKLINLRPEMSVYDAINLFLKYKISGACVVEDKNKLVGIYSEKDCLKELKNRVYFNQPGGHVRDYMAKSPQIVGPDEKLINISDIFLFNSFKLIPVVDNDKLVGIISRRDVIKVMKKYRKK